MGRAFSDITFTPAVRAMQSRMGSRAQYAGFDLATDPHNTLRGQEIAFISTRDHFFQATVSETGWPYVQHRGGPPGFLKVLDTRTIGFADFAGNVQYISVGNLQTDDRISMILMDYAEQIRLKLIGRVQLVDIDDDPELVERVRVPGHNARIERAFIIHIEGYDWNCPLHITPRFTQVEVAAMTAPLQSQLRRFKEAAAAQVRKARPAAIGEGALALRVSGIRQLTPEIRAYELRTIDGGPLPQVAAGAHLAIPVLLEDGTNDTRCYSITSDPGQRHVYEIAVQREVGGKGGSMSVHAAFDLGLVLHCGSPRNDFALHDDVSPVLLLAGGIGITPLRSMALALLAQGRRFEIHYAARSRDSAAYLDELHQLLGARLHFYASNESRLDIDNLFGRAEQGFEVYVCGPNRMIDAARTAAAAAGISADKVHFERFAASGKTDGDKTVFVTLARSGRELEVPPGRSILDAVQDAGIAAPASCRIGNCGTCAVKVLAGRPDHRDGALSETEREAGSMCICVSRSLDERLTLDL